MKQGEERHERFNFWIWLGNGLKAMFKTVGSIVKTVLIISLIGAALWFGGRFIYQFGSEIVENERKADEWSVQHSRFEVGKLLPLPNTEKGTEFYKLVEAISKEKGEIVFIVQVNEDGGVIKVSDIDSENVVLVDSLIETPKVVLKSKQYARRVYDKEGMTITEYLQSHFIGLKDERIYIYIKKDQTAKFIKKEG